MVVINLYFAGVKMVGVAGEHGNGNMDTRIHLNSLQCIGNESEIYQCMRNEQPTDCTHDNDVSVECLRMCILSMKYLCLLDLISQQSNSELFTVLLGLSTLCFKTSNF